MFQGPREVSITYSIPKNLNCYSVVPEALIQQDATCLANSFVMCIEIYMGLFRARGRRWNKAPRKLSLQYIVDNFYEIGNYHCPGTDECYRGYTTNKHATQFFNWTHNHGVPFEEHYTPGQSIPSHMRFHSPQWKCLGPNRPEMFRYVCTLLHEGPVIASFPLGAEFYANNGKNIHRGLDTGPGYKIEMHSVVVTGHGVDKETGESVIEFLNSWGPNWGYEGRGYVLASLISDYRMLTHYNLNY